MTTLNTWKKYFTIILITTIMGQVYFNPFASDFRISFGVAALTILLLFFSRISIIMAALLSAFSVFIFRFSVDLASGAVIYSAALKHYPSILFYVSFGLLLHYLDFRKYSNTPFFFVAVVGLSDAFSNVVELVIRGNYEAGKLGLIFSSLLLTGILRAGLSLVAYTAVSSYNMLIRKKEHEKRYIDLLISNANLKTEVFFLKKAIVDIESAMAKSYSLYDELKDSVEIIYTDRLLGITKDIHEIKKDHLRVIAGLNKIHPITNNPSSMKLGTIFKILIENTNKFLDSKNLPIEISASFKCDKSVKVCNYYSLISVVNNLVMNSIESIDGSGFVRLKCVNSDGYYEFRVFDNGSGIDNDDLDFVFSPGFTTKFDKRTGELSQGVGLTHVKELIESVFQGEIKVESQLGHGTTFMIRIKEECL